MSAIASFVLLPRAALPGLRAAATQSANDTYWDFLQQTGREVADYQWSGHVLATLLCWLNEEHQVNLFKSSYDELANFLSKERGHTHLVFTNEQKTAYLQQA